MTKNILVFNQKGGVGKSLIADEIAFSFERVGIPVSFYDLDSQGGTIHKTTDVPGAQAAVIDTPGAIQADLKTWMNEADLVVVPTRTTSRELDVLVNMIGILDEHPDIPAVIVLNAVNRFKMCTEFKEWFKDAYKSRTVCQLPDAQDFVKATVNLMSVVQFAPRSKAAKATVEMTNTIKQILGFEQET